MEHTINHYQRLFWGDFPRWPMQRHGGVLPQRRASQLNRTQCRWEQKSLQLCWRSSNPKSHRNAFGFGRSTVVSFCSHGRTNRCVLTRNVDECDPHSDAARCIRWDYSTKGSRRAEPRLKNSSCHQSRVVARCVKS